MPPVKEPPSALDHVPAVPGLFGTFLMSEQEINVPLAGGIEGVLVDALEAGLGADGEFPTDGTLQDGGHVAFTKPD